MGKFYEVTVFQPSSEERLEAADLVLDVVPEGASERMKWAKAHHTLALSLLNEESGTENKEYGFALLKIAYDSKAILTSDKVYLALCYFYGRGIPEDNDKALEIAKEAYEGLKDNPRYSSWSWDILNMIKFYTTSISRRNEIETLKDKLNESNSTINYIKKQYDELLNSANKGINEYNELVEKFKTLRKQNEERVNDYNEVVGKYNTLLEQYKQRNSDYNKLLDEYRKLVDEYNKSLRDSQTTKTNLKKAELKIQQANDKERLVKVRINYIRVWYYGSDTNEEETIEIRYSEYKALLNGSMKAREAFVNGRFDKPRPGSVTIQLIDD